MKTFVDILIWYKQYNDKLESYIIHTGGNIQLINYFYCIKYSNTIRTRQVNTTMIYRSITITAVYLTRCKKNN